MTRARSAALAVLRDAAEPLSAAAVHQEVGACCDQATVYRTLHYLEKKGLAESFILHCDEHGTERYYAALEEPGRESAPHRHWFHCEACHRFTEIGACTVDGLIRDFESGAGVSVRRHVLYFTGLCKECRK
jgi:Fur family ferric uptake transcriptional regulator